MSVHEHLPSVIGVTSVLSKSQQLCSGLKCNIYLKNWWFNSSLPLGTCTVLRSRECILEGSELHWTDRVFCDGKVYLTLDRNDTWTPHVPQALALKELWDQEVERTRQERIRLQEGCFSLMRELGLSVETSGTWNNSKLFGTVVFCFKKKYLYLFLLAVCLSRECNWRILFFPLSYISSSDTFTSVCDPSFVHLGFYWAHRNQPPLLQRTGWENDQCSDDSLASLFGIRKLCCRVVLLLWILETKRETGTI